MTRQRICPFDHLGGRPVFSIAICEDENYLLEELHKKAETYLKARHLPAEIHTFTTGEDLLEEQCPFDLILLDMVLPGMNGLEAAKRLSRKAPIIFITSYREYAVDAFEVEAVHYLLKPVTDDRLYQAMDRALDRSGQADARTLALKESGKTHILPIRDILYCEVFDHRVCIHTAQDNYEYSGTLGMLGKELDGRFFRCHRSYLINMSCVVAQEKGTAIVSNGSRVLISRRKQSEFMQRLLDYLKNEVI